MTDPASTSSENPYIKACGELHEWLSDLAREADRSNRALVLVAAARLDLELENMVKAVLTWNPDGQDSLFDPDRPLGTFSAKISIAHRLGLLDNEFHSALQIIRRLRNDFAHSIDLMKLSEPPHKDRISELTRLASKHMLWDMALSMMQPPWLSDQSKHYGAAMIVMTISMLAIGHNEQRFRPRQNCRFSINSVALPDNS